MVFTDGGVRIDRQPSDLDRLVLDVVAVLVDAGLSYAVVSGYVAPVRTCAGDRGRRRHPGAVRRRDARLARGRTHRGGVLVARDAARRLSVTLADDRPVRLAEDGHRVPNVELEFAGDRYDRSSLEETLTVRFGEETFSVGSLELQIAYKLHVDTPWDFRDAL